MVHCRSDTTAVLAKTPGPPVRPELPRPSGKTPTAQIASNELAVLKRSDLSCLRLPPIEPPNPARATQPEPGHPPQATPTSS